MSTRAMCPDKESLVSYLYDEFDGSEPLSRQEMERHLDECESCAADVAAFGGVRQQLREWTAPENTPLGFRVVREPAVKARWWTGRSIPFPLAAAAALVLGVGLGIARLDVQYDAQGLRVRTGWGHQDAISGSGALAASAPGAVTSVPGAVTTAGDAANASAQTVGLTAGGGVPSGASAAAPAGGALASGAGVPGASLVSTSIMVGGIGAQPVSSGSVGAGSVASGSAVSGAPWRADMQVLERQLRQEFASLRQAEGRQADLRGGAGSTVQAASLVGDPSSGGIRSADAATLQRIQQLIDQSEVRQQQNLALRIAELSREFDVQRRTDLVRIEQGFGRLNDQRELDAQQQRQILNAIRVSQQKPQ